MGYEVDFKQVLFYFSVSPHAICLPVRNNKKALANAMQLCSPLPNGIQATSKCIWYVWTVKANFFDGHEAAE